MLDVLSLPQKSSRKVVENIMLKWQIHLSSSYYYQVSMVSLDWGIQLTCKYGQLGLGVTNTR